MIKQFLERFTSNPFDQLLKRAQENGDTRILLTWNRGLGDIALGIYALIYRIKEYIPNASITFLTRTDLALGFELLNAGKVVSCLSWKRGTSFNLEKSFYETGLRREDFDLIIENADPTKWVKWQLGNLVPELHWKNEWDILSKKFELSGMYLGVHVNSETTYGYQKNWDSERWNAFFKKWCAASKIPLLLFGFNTTPIYAFENLFDLRGKTSLFEMLSIIKNHCSHLVLPDSGVLSITYFLKSSFPLKIVSLWADPRQGVLKQNVLSPNPLLHHIPLIGKNEDIHAISVDALYEALNGT